MMVGASKTRQTPQSNSSINESPSPASAVELSFYIPTYQHLSLPPPQRYTEPKKKINKASTPSGSSRKKRTSEKKAIDQSSQPHKKPHQRSLHASDERKPRAGIQYARLTTYVHTYTHQTKRSRETHACNTSSKKAISFLPSFHPSRRRSSPPPPPPPSYTHTHTRDRIRTSQQGKKEHLPIPHHQPSSPIPRRSIRSPGPRPKHFPQTCMPKVDKDR